MKTENGLFTAERYLLTLRFVVEFEELEPPETPPSFTLEEARAIKDATGMAEEKECSDCGYFAGGCPALLTVYVAEFERRHPEMSLGYGPDFLSELRNWREFLRGLAASGGEEARAG